MKFWSDHYQDFVSKEQWQEGHAMDEQKKDPETMCAADLRKHQGRRIGWAYYFSIFAIWVGNAALCAAFDHHPTWPEQAWFYASMLLLVLCHRARLAALDARCIQRRDHWWVGEYLKRLDTDLHDLREAAGRFTIQRVEETIAYNNIRVAHDKELARLNDRSIALEHDAAKRIHSLEQRLDATIRHQDQMDDKYLNLDRACADILRAQIGGKPVPYAPQGVCADAADANGAIFDALALAAKGEVHVPDHIEAGDTVIFDGGMFGRAVLLGEVVVARPGTLEVKPLNVPDSISMTISRDILLAHQPKEA